MTNLVRENLRFLLLPLVFALGLGISLGQDKGGNSKSPKSGGKGSGEQKLSQEDRERIRAVLAEAWSRPDVIAARDEVHSATEAYKQAL
ncbi:MAG: hypothetical protein AAGH89_05775, partial [Verrucomicrobiota bacterium]